jgi:hypothetical protein
MALGIPKYYIPILGEIHKLSDASIGELLLALESSGVAASSYDLAEHIADSVPSIPRKTLNRIIEGIFSLYHVRESSELDRSNFWDELVEGVREYAKPKLLDKEIPHLRDRFKRLLNIETLAINAKAVRLQRDGERLYCEAKIISDIRPVFSENIKSAPVAATITHTLKIGFHEDGNHREFFVVLDELDLDDLQKTIKRAKTKADTLTKLLDDSNIPTLGI